MGSLERNQVTESEYCWRGGGAIVIHSTVGE
jgi:hypothetical protein